MKPYLPKLAACLVLSLSLLTGCITSSTRSTNHLFTEGKNTVFIPTHYRGYEAEFIGEFRAVLERHGFELADRKGLSHYQFNLMIYPGHVETSLFEGRSELLSIETTTPWDYPWPQTIQNRSMIRRAVSDFDQVLTEILER